MKKLQPSPPQLEPEKSISMLGFYPREFLPEEASAKFPDCLQIIEKMLKNREQTDTRVAVGQETFDCHMVVLKSYSEYFEKLEKNKELDIRIVILPDDKVTPIAFNMIYDWMLSDENRLPRSHFAELFKAAKFLNVRELRNQMICCIGDKKIIGEREALSIYLEANEVDEKQLQEFMLKKISKIFLTFVASWEFLMLNLEEVEEFFKSNRLGVNSELDMLFAALRWLQHEWPKRKKSVKLLMQHVRFELIKSWQLVELKKYPKELEHIFKIQNVQEMIDKALAAIALQNADLTEDKPTETFSRRIINDPMWNKYEFEKNPNVYENYHNFSAYLNRLDACHWRKLKYADPKHESVVL